MPGLSGEQQEQPRNMSVEKPKPPGQDGGQKTAGKIRSWISKNRDRPREVWDKFKSKGEEESQQPKPGSESAKPRDTFGFARKTIDFLLPTDSKTSEEKAEDRAKQSPTRRFLSDTFAMAQITSIPSIAAVVGAYSAGVPAEASLGFLALGPALVPAERVVGAGVKMIEKIKNRNNSSNQPKTS